MSRPQKRFVLVPPMLLVAALFLLAQPAQAFSPDERFAHVYYGKYNNFSLGNTVSCQQPKSIDSFKDSNIGAIGLGFYYNFVESFFSLGAEVNYASHWGQSDSYAGEFAIAAVARYNAYKQFDKLPLFFSIGDGVSYITGVPSAERKYGYSADGDATTMNKRLLNFLFLETGVHVDTGFEVFARVHHRCTAYGLYGQKSGGSDYLTLGLRYFF